jgi:Flp pilus assembly protein TadG
LIEFALCLPLLLLIVLGIVDFSFLLQKHQVLANAAREGARMSVLPGYDYSDDAVKARVAKYVLSAGITATPVTVVTRNTMTVDGASMTTKKVVVTLTHKFSYLYPIARLFSGGTFDEISLGAASEMRAEVPGYPQ